MTDIPAGQSGVVATSGVFNINTATPHWSILRFNSNYTSLLGVVAQSSAPNGWAPTGIPASLDYTGSVASPPIVPVPSSVNVTVPVPAGTAPGSYRVAFEAPYNSPPSVPVGQHPSGNFTGNFTVSPPVAADDDEVDGDVTWTREPTRCFGGTAEATVCLSGAAEPTVCAPWAPVAG